ncbi:hypothetical protein GG344DRAFT_67637 [Lentinula edodes]|nr:hypothetical protein GG344DRAFT_67637 [Lentinula edodes]
MLDFNPPLQRLYVTGDDPFETPINHKHFRTMKALCPELEVIGVDDRTWRNKQVTLPVLNKIALSKEESRIAISEQNLKRAEDALKTGDLFVLSRSEVSWEGEWVDPRWKQAAQQRLEIEEQKQKEEDRRRVEEAHMHAWAIYNLENKDLEYDYSTDLEDDNSQDGSAVKSRSSTSPSSSLGGTSLERASKIVDTSVKESPSQNQSISNNSISQSKDTVPTTAISNEALEVRIIGNADVSDPSMAMEKRKKRPRIDNDDEAQGGCKIAGPKVYFAPSTPVAHPLLPFDYRGLSEEAQLALKFRHLNPLSRDQDQDIISVLKYHFTPGSSIQATEAWVKEVSQTLVGTTNSCLRVPTAIMLDVSVSGLLTELVVTVVGMRGNVALVTHFDGIELAANFHAMTQRRSEKKWKKLPLGALRLLLRTPSGTKKVTYRLLSDIQSVQQLEFSIPVLSM